MKKVIIYPGSFDPIHAGHVNTLKSACEFLHINNPIVLLQPNWFKNPGMFTVEYRLKLVKEAMYKISDNLVARIIVPHTPYFFEFILQLIEENKLIKEKIQYYLLIGDDILNSISKWKNFESIIRPNCDIIIQQRDFDINDIEEKLSELMIYDYVILPNRLHKKYSSTELREKIGLCLINELNTNLNKEK